jgi:hypothetical protein
VTKSEGASRINGVRLGELSVNLQGPSVVMAATVGLVDTESGDSFGRLMQNTSWSEETLEKLQELIFCIERDVCKTVFDEGATTPSGEGEFHPPDSVPGL